MQNQTEALLEGLIADCHGIIRDDLLPIFHQQEKEFQQRNVIHSVTDMMKSAVELADAIGRLRGTAPQPELRQRITVERIQRLSSGEGRGE